MPTPEDAAEPEMPITPEPSFVEDMEPNAAVAGDGEEEAPEKKHRQRPRKQKLYAAIRKQMEFYFSDANITKQRMMKEIVLASDYVNLQIFLEKFNKVSQLSKNIDDFRRALKHSDKLEMSEDELGVRRKVPFDEAKVKTIEDVENCTIYVENIPPDVNHDWIEKTFQEFGQVAYISLPKFRRNGQPKGFAFVEFEEEEATKRCLEAYGEIGACLPGNIDPSGLLSVTTYNEEMKSNAQDKSKSKPKKKGRMKKGEKSDVKSESGEFEARKRRLETNEDETDLLRVSEDESGKAKKLKRSVTFKESPEKVEEKAEESEMPEKALDNDSVPVVPDSTVPDAETEDVLETETPKSGKKKRKKKKSKGGTDEKLESDLIHLRILPKKHWRQLRNRYLNLQRENMSKLKAQLRTEENRRYLEQAAPLVSNKSICVKVSLSTPADSVETFKSQIVNELVPLDWSNLVKHVDYEEGKLEAIVRLDGNPKGKEGVDMFVQNAGRVFKNVFPMTDAETDAYWSALRVTLKKRQKEKTRGKDRLLNQAMKVGSSHIHFEEAEKD